MKPITHGIPNARHVRRKKAREKLDAAGWECHGGSWLLDGLWTHARLPGHTVSRAAAVTLQAAWDAEAKAEVA